jgi:plasmid stability protein
MGKAPKRTTISFKQELHRKLRMRAAETSRSMSDLVNLAVRLSLTGEEEDPADFYEGKSEAQISVDKMVAQFKKDGVL